MCANKIFFMCPCLDVTPEGIVCVAAKDLIKNIKNVNLNICMSTEQFKSCNIYISHLKKPNVIPESPTIKENQTI